jgi:hypothetical protein
VGAFGLTPRGAFQVASAKEFPSRGYDLVAAFDCLHDVGDPVGVAAHVRAALADGGTWMVVEPFVQDRMADNLNPLGRAYYAASTMICTPTSLFAGGRPRPRRAGRQGAPTRVHWAASHFHTAAREPSQR